MIFPQRAKEIAANVILRGEQQESGIISPYFRHSYVNCSRWPGSYA
jgi:hypothetical protein